MENAQTRNASLRTTAPSLTRTRAGGSWGLDSRLSGVGAAAFEGAERGRGRGWGWGRGSYLWQKEYPPTGTRSPGALSPLHPRFFGGNVTVDLGVSRGRHL